MSNVVIINYGVGNITSVMNALRRLNVSVTVSDTPSDIHEATHLIFPGVGSFQEGMHGIRERGLIPVLQEAVIDRRKPILGICLGMQLFASVGQEYGSCDGLGFLPGVVRMIDTSQSQQRLPHIGWNDVQIRGGHAMTEGFSTTPVFYFVHSYQFIPEDQSIIAGTCQYGEAVTALIQKDNICGAQFHPEKSNEDGLQIFRNFLTL
jgi:glutamine amidotransferase